MIGHAAPSELPSTTQGIPLHSLQEAIHLGADELPFVEIRPGTELQLVQVDLAQGVWVIRSRYLPGTVLKTHYHTGPVFGFTLKGCWFYREYPEVRNTAGSYLFEPAHSVHSLTVPDSNDDVTEVWFAITGANLDVDEDGTVTGVTDARSILATYRERCAVQGLSCEKTIVLGE